MDLDFQFLNVDFYFYLVLLSWCNLGFYINCNVILSVVL